VSLATVRVVAITDRRLAPIARVAELLARVPRGSVLIQLREKDLDGAQLFELARELVAIAAPAGAPVWINDRIDVASLAGADGAHLPEACLPIADARRVAAVSGRPLALGCSRHTHAGCLAAARAGAELIQLGPIFDTPDKTAIGPGALQLRRELPPTTHLVAVGGIDSPARAAAAVSAGADAIAAIRALWSAADPAATIAALVAAVDEALARPDRLQ
jgi:thiamine-phosphate pyrophosphorylase